MQRCTRRIVSVIVAVCLLLSLMPLFPQIAFAADSMPPGWIAGYPNMDTVAHVNGRIKVKTDESGKVYYVILPAGSAAPLALEVKAGTGKSGTTPVTSGNINVTANTATNIDPTGLTDITMYDAYLVTEDSALNLQQIATKVRVSTDILAHFSFEGSLIDDSGNENNGTALGSPSFSNGFAGQAINLNGSSCMVLPFDLLRTHTTFTVTMRFKTTSTGSILGYQNQATNSGTIPTNYIPILYIDKNGKLNALLWTGESLRVTTGSPVNDNVWHKVTMTATGESVSIYIDNEVPEVNSGAVLPLDMSYNQIGTAFNDYIRDAAGLTEGDLCILNYYTGLIDDVYIISKGISSSDVDNLTNDAPKADTISILNKSSGASDTITASGLSPGDIITVYSAITGGTLLGTATVASGNTQAVVSIPQLGTVSGSVYVSVTKAGGTESSRTQVPYISEAAQAANDSIAQAKALLPTSFTATPGVNTNLLTSLNAISGMSTTGVTLSLTSNSPNIANDGTITYTGSPVTGNVVVYINKSDGTQDTMIISVTTLAEAVPPPSERSTTSTKSASEYKIVSTSGTGGSISPSGIVSVLRGGSKTYMITPDKNYIISDVLVDGKSVGAVASYVFSNNSSAHSIAAVFTKATGLPYYFDEKGSKVFIGFATDARGEMKYIAPNGKIVLLKENPKSFTDISGHWAKANIGFVTERELFLGTSSNTFSPQMGMTRAMFATVIGRIYERSYEKLVKTSSESKFKDVDFSAYYGDYVEWAAENNIIAGVGASKFEPNREVTREEMAAILYRFAKFLNALGTGDSQLKYPDASDISLWAVDAAKYCQQTGIISGSSGGNFVPRGIATRAEVAAILQRFIENTLEF